MLDSSTDRMIHMIIVTLMLPLIIAGGFYILDDGLFTTSTEDSTEIVAESNSVIEEEPVITEEEKAAKEVEEQKQQEEALAEFTTDLANFALGALKVAGALIAGAVGVIGVFKGIEWLHESEGIQRLLFTWWMKRKKIPAPLRHYYEFIEKHRSVLPEQITEPLRALKTDIKENKAPMHYAYIALMEEDFVEAMGKLSVIVKNKAYLKTFQKHYNAPTSVELETIYEPLRKGIRVYNNRKAEFHKLSTDTQENELNMLLSQSFSKLKSFPTYK